MKPHPSAPSSFSERVRTAVRNIPRGQTRTYKQIATAAGAPGASRAVGTIMANNYDPTVPCHRVIRSDGSIGDYNRGGTKAKEKLLKQERAVR